MCMVHHRLGLLLGKVAPIMMPNGIDFYFDFFPWCKVEDDRAEVQVVTPSGVSTAV